MSEIGAVGHGKEGYAEETSTLSGNPRGLRLRGVERESTLEIHGTATGS